MSCVGIISSPVSTLLAHWQSGPTLHLLRQKMSHAASRLLQKGATVQQVADEMGFGDPFHFSRVFRKVMGLAPGQFARMHQRA